MGNFSATPGEGFKILIADDDPVILKVITRYLTGYGFKVLTATNGEEALDLLAENQPDLLLLDMLMPPEGGLEVCRQIRNWNQMPIIILSGLGEEDLKVKALEIGADDYLTKPFGLNELVARIKVAIRRSRMVKTEPNQVYSIDDLIIDFTRRLVTLKGQEIKLTNQQYELLKYLAQHAGQVITHRMALQQVWGPAYEAETQYLHVFIGQLRQKIEPNPAQPIYITNERGVGYRFKELTKK